LTHDIDDAVDVGRVQIAHNAHPLPGCRHPTWTFRLLALPRVSMNLWWVETAGVGALRLVSHSIANE
jgi:hypothetical protein